MLHDSNNLARLKANFLGAELSRVTDAFVQAAHRGAQRVHVWTVDDSSNMERMFDLGVDDLITNEPEEALRHVRNCESLNHSARTLRRGACLAGQFEPCHGNRCHCNRDRAPGPIPARRLRLRDCFL